MIVGYTYKAENLCPACTLVAMGGLAESADDANAENVLTFVAGIMDVNRNNEDSFDSDDFPKVITDQMIEDLGACDACIDEGYGVKSCSNNLCDECQREMM